MGPERKHPRESAADRRPRRPTAEPAPGPLVQALTENTPAQQASEERFRRLVEVSSEIVWVTNADGEPVEDSPSWRAFTGRALEEWLGRSWLEAIHPDDRGRVAEAWKHAVATVGAYKVEFRLIHRSGEYRHIACRAAPVLDPDGTVRDWVGMNEDITERKRTEGNQALLSAVLQALNRGGDVHPLLRETVRLIRSASGFDAVGLRLRRGEDCPYFEEDGFSEEFLEEENLLCDRRADGAVVRDAQGRAALACACGLVLSGRTDPRMACFTAGGSFWTNLSTELLSLPSDADPRTNPRNRCIRAGYLSVGLFPICSGGETIGLLQLNDRRAGRFTLALVAFYEGLAQSLGLALQRLAADQALRGSEERLRRAQEIAHLGSWELDHVANRLTWSEEVYRIFGLEPGAFPATYEAFLEAVHPQDRAAVDQAYSGSLREDRDGYETEHRVVRASTGEVRVVHEKCEHLRDAGGRIVRSVGMVHDVTDRKRAGEELRRTQERVRAKLRSILSPEGTLGDLELGDIVDAPAIQQLLEDFYRLVPVPVSLIDLKGRVLVGVGWQEVCTKFHRVHPETCAHCLESDTQLSRGIPAGEWRLYKCKNNLWDVATPIVIGGEHVGNLFSGQFFFEGEVVDTELFRAQARQCGFPEEEYLAALERVPRLSREVLDRAMGFYLKLADMISRLSYSNLKLARSLAERQSLTESLRATNEQLELYRILAGETRDVILFMRRDDGRLLEANAAATAAYGYSREELLALCLQDLRAPETRELTASQMAEADEKGILFETVHRRKDGRTFPVEVSARGAGVGGERVLVSVVRDISERKRTEEALRHGQSILAQAGKMANLGAWEIEISRDDVHANPLRWSDEVYRIFGYEPGGVEVTNDFFFERVHPEDRQAIREAVARAIERRRPYSFEHRIVRPDGSERVVFEHAEITFDAQGRPTHVVGAVQDVTERKRTEEVLREAKSAAEAASRAKSDFLARMSHELRTPMNAIMGMTELVLMEDNLHESAREFLRLSKDSAKGLLEIINDLLDIARVEAGRVELDERAFDLGRSIGNLLAPFRVAAERKGLSLVARLDEALPPRVVGDEGRLRQVLTNIVGNALKFTERGTVEVTVGPGPEAAGAGRTRLLFGVRDEGIGIAPENLRAIFESFSSATTSTHARFGGTGLGLSIAKHLVELMGGRVWVESEPGKGSFFQFTVEVGLPEAALPAGEPAAPCGEAGERLRVLVAEDNPLNQLFARELLARFGHEVSVVSDGEQVLRALAAYRFDVVLMDVQMPLVNGDEATRRVRAGLVEGCPRDLPIVAVTAHALHGDRERFLEAGMDDYLSKPFDPKALEEVLGRVAQRRPAGNS